MLQSENPTFYVCHLAHEHDRVFTENICEYFREVGVRYDIIEFEAPGNRPELRKCLDGGTSAVLGFNR